MRLAHRLLAAWLVLGFVAPVSAQTATINFSDTKQQIDGFGAANSALGLTPAMADLFFTTVGLSLFRLPFSSNSAGPTPYYPELALIADFYNAATLAAARGAKVWAAPWTAPNTTWKDNGSWVQGHLLSGHFADYASYIGGLQADLVTAGGPTLYGMSIVNEPDLSNGAVSYESMQMSAADFVTVIKNNVGPTLAGLSHRPLLIAPETESWDTAATYASTILADTTAAGYVDVIATHQYVGTVAPISTSKRVWQTEMSGIADTFDATMTHGLTVAGWIHSALTTGNVNAWHYWWTRAPSGKTDNEALIGNNGDDTITKRLYVLGQWAKWIRPGWFRTGVTLTSVPAGVSVEAYRSNHNTGIAILVINTSGSSQSITYTLQGLTTGTVIPCVTSTTQDMAILTSVTVTAGSFTTSVANNTVTTFVGTLSQPVRRRNRR